MSTFSVFSEGAVNNHKVSHTITISDPRKENSLPSVSGYITDDVISPKFSAKWENVTSGVVQVDDTARKLLNLNGKTGFNTGIYSKLYFTEGSWFTFSVNFEIIDEEGTGKVLQALKTLQSYVSPASATGELGESIGNLLGKASEGVRELGSTLGIGGLVNALTPGQAVAKRLAQDAISSAPPIPFVKVGEMIAGNFIITSISPNIKNDLIGDGHPVSAKVNISFTSQEVLVKGGKDYFLSKGNTKVEGD